MSPSSPLTSYSHRNASIVARRQAGETYVSLASAFGISAHRVRQIYERHAPPISADELVRRADVMLAEREARAYGSPLGRELNVSRRTANILAHAGYWTTASVRSLSDAELLAIPRFGRRALAEVRPALTYHAKLLHE